MRVVEVAAFGGPDALTVAERPDPVAAPGQVLIRVHAANVNPTDLSVRDGSVVRRNPRVTPPVVPGWDLAGEIAALGDGVTGLEAGQRVVAMLHWPTYSGTIGAYSELVALDAALVVPTPDGVDDPTAATIPLNALTADQALQIIDPAPGTTLLVTGASGAVGAFGAQFAVQRGLRVIAQAGRDDEDFVWSLGVEDVLPRDADLTSIDEVDNVFDAVPLGPVAATRMAPGGTAVFTRGIPAHPPAPEGQRYEVVLCKDDAVALRRVVADVGDGLIATRVAQVLPLADAPRAHELTEAGGNHGKIVLAL
jgi:NADPH:quinone reductase-like Zn-dependent oxidoreductase